MYHSSIVATAGLGWVGLLLLRFTTHIYIHTYMMWEEDGLR